MDYCLRIGVMLLLSLFYFHSAASLAQTTAVGDYHMGKFDKDCNRLDGTMERNYPGYSPLGDLSFAFYSGKAENLDLCLTSLFPPGGERLSDVAFLITELDGMVLEELTTPQSTNPGPLEDCWPNEVVFDDFNGDGSVDILLMIGCYNGEADRPENDNVVYLSEKSEGTVWLRQRENMNRLVGSYTDSAQAVTALKRAVSGAPPSSVSGPTPPSTPPPAPLSADVEVCTYNTEWGEMTLQFDYETGGVIGSYAYRGGRIHGSIQDNTLTGTWTQNDGTSGGFSFDTNKWGFQGVWNYSGDQGWRGDWNGQLLRCR